jgi:small-conductance mechanosensitive channel
MSEKYVFANIKLPILIKENKTIEPLVEYINMSFEPCKELPEKNTSSHNYSMLLQSILSTISEEVNTEKGEEEKKEKTMEEEVKIEADETTPSILIQKNEIQSRQKQLHNITFRNKKVTSSHRKTCKILDNIVTSNMHNDVPLEEAFSLEQSEACASQSIN